ncbi:MAG: hypothetical protein AB9846_10285 [Tenuifilaceae bacterium]
MQLLDKKQVEIIVADVEKARVTFSHLADELIDHICCEVENLMNQGKSFDEAYEFMKQQTGIKVLQKIQENTHYLIDKNYRIMKMAMKITGSASLVILSVGTVMKLVHWQGASTLLLFGFLVLCLVFFPSAIYTNYKDQKIKGSVLLHLSILIGGILFMAGVLFKVLHLKGAAAMLFVGWVFILFVFLPLLLYIKLKESISKRDKIIILIGIIGLMIFELSTMFKLFHFKGAAVLMIVGSILLVSVFIPLFTYSKFKEVGKITGQYIFIIIGTMFFILFSTLLALNVSKDILGTLVNEERNSAKITSYLELKNQKLYDDFTKKSDSTKLKYESKVFAIQNEVKKVCYLVDSIRIELIMSTEQVDKQTAKNISHNLAEISNKTEMDLVNNMMIGENCDGLASKLKQSLKEFKDLIQSIPFSDTDINKTICSLLDTSDKSIKDQNQKWEIYTFSDNPLISTLTVLMDIEKKVKMAEKQSIQYINSQN